MTFAISAMNFYWIGGTKFSADPNEAVLFVRAEDAERVVSLVPIRHPMSIVNLSGAEQPGVIDLGEESPIATPSAHPAVMQAGVVTAQQRRAPQAQQPQQHVIGTKQGRQGQQVKIAAHPPGTRPVQFMEGGPGIHRLNPNRTAGTQDPLQKDWGRPKGATVAGLSEDGAVTDREEFSPGQPVDPLS